MKNTTSDNGAANSNRLDVIQHEMKVLEAKIFELAEYKSLLDEKVAYLENNTPRDALNAEIREMENKAPHVQSLIADVQNGTLSGDVHEAAYSVIKASKDDLIPLIREQNELKGIKPNPLKEMLGLSQKIVKVEASDEAENVGIHIAKAAVLVGVCSVAMGLMITSSDNTAVDGLDQMIKAGEAYSETISADFDKTLENVAFEAINLDDVVLDNFQNLQTDQSITINQEVDTSEMEEERKSNWVSFGIMPVKY